MLTDIINTYFRVAYEKMAKRFYVLLNCAVHVLHLFCGYFRGLEIQNVLSSSQLNTVCNVLRWVYLLEYNRTSQLQSVSITLKLSRIMCVFLTGKINILSCEMCN